MYFTSPAYSTITWFLADVILSEFYIQSWMFVCVHMCMFVCLFTMEIISFSIWYHQICHATSWYFNVNPRRICYESEHLEVVRARGLETRMHSLIKELNYLLPLCKYKPENLQLPNLSYSLKVCYFDCRQFSSSQGPGVPFTTFAKGKPPIDHNL